MRIIPVAILCSVLLLYNIPFEFYSLPIVQFVNICVVFHYLCIRKSPIKNILGHVKKKYLGLYIIGRKKIQTNRRQNMYFALRGKSSGVGQKSLLKTPSLFP